MSKFKEGDRVVHKSLGTGTVTERLPADFLVMVEYDKTPAREYNMGQNPTAALVSSLERIN